LPTPSRRTETRHATPGNACTHFLKYGMTCNSYDRLRRRANGRCELCKTPETRTPRGALVIDHFQAGDLFFVRGLLCDKCNSVMSRHDRKTAWGPSSLPFKEKARAYHLAAFEQPSPEEFAQADQAIHARKPYAVKDRILPHIVRPKVAYIRMDRPLPEIASKLRRNLDAREVTHLIALLAEDR
jgi:hypothetical protein